MEAVQGNNKASGNNGNRLKNTVNVKSVVHAVEVKRMFSLLPTKQHINAIPPEPSWLSDDDLWAQHEKEHPTGFKTRLDWVDHHVLQYEKFKELSERLKRAGIRFLREDWKQYCGDNDWRLINAIMILRKNNMFNVESLANADERVVGALLLLVGFNFHNPHIHYLIGAAKRIKERGGELPGSHIELLSYFGFQRKIVVLVLQEVFGQTETAFVGDVHLGVLFPLFGYCENLGKNVVALTRQVEAWFPKELFFEVNVVWCGLRQLWTSKDKKLSERQRIRATMEKMIDGLAEENKTKFPNFGDFARKVLTARVSDVVALSFGNELMENKEPPTASKTRSKSRPPSPRRHDKASRVKK